MVRFNFLGRRWYLARGGEGGFKCSTAFECLVLIGDRTSMENHLYHPNMEGRAGGLGWHTKWPASPYRNPRSCSPPLCHLCYSRQVSDILPAVGSQIARSWAGAAGIIRSGNCSQGKFSEELTSDGWRRLLGAGRAVGEGGLGSRRRKMRSSVKARRMLAASEEGRGGLGCF